MVETPRGKVREFVRSDDPDFPGFGQFHIVETNPGVVRAWFRHQRQHDQCYVIAGKVRFGFYDDRPDSPTKGAVVDLVVDAETPLLIGFPPLIWHGFATVGERASVMVQHNNQAFIHAGPDEEKRASDDAYFPFRW